ncbi:DUF58 domain-containing protein [Motilimonas eburnea]|uniref:DUF58 domain-containing protein n=1 Tax=Motilimonas eburnea TaxID=1737488 RepID=UPI001E512266|nr:DUF58 domain-containing protein [Motilimonas eburnea]MCE2571969.1 DUF58 domain-containing protein [Motilimonas eburnea]
MAQTKSLQLTFIMFLLLGLLLTNATLVAMSLFPLSFLLVATMTQPALKLKLRREVTKNNHYIVLDYHISSEHGNISHLYLKEKMPASLKAKAADVELVAPLKQGEPLVYRHEIPLSRGQFDFNQIEVSAADYIGQVYQRENVLQPASIAQVPAAQGMGNIPLNSRKTFGFNGVVAAGKAGTGEAFFGLGQYQDHMPSKAINWRASAKHESLLLANEFEQDSNMNVGLILDARQLGAMGSNASSSVLASGLDLTLTLGLSMAKSLLRSGHRLGLLTLGQQLDYVYPQCGRRQLRKIEQALTKVEPSKAGGLNLWALENKPGLFFPNKANLVMISQLQHGDLHLLQGLKRAGYYLTVIVPDPSGLVAGEHQQQVKDLYHLHRESLLQEFKQLFKQHGITLITWPMEQELSQFYHQALVPALRLQRRRG